MTRHRVIPPDKGPTGSNPRRVIDLPKKDDTTNSHRTHSRSILRASLRCRKIRLDTSLHGSIRQVSGRRIGFRQPRTRPVRGWLSPTRASTTHRVNTRTSRTNRGQTRASRTHRSRATLPGRIPHRRIPHRRIPSRRIPSRRIPHSLLCGSPTPRGPIRHRHNPHSPISDRNRRARRPLIHPRPARPQNPVHRPLTIRQRPVEPPDVR